MNREPLHALHTLEVYEPIERDAGGAGSKTEDFCSLIAIERLEDSPPPYNDRVRTIITVVVRRRSPFIHINVRCTGNQ
jgi:hypothetical protein